MRRCRLNVNRIDCWLVLWAEGDFWSTRLFYGVLKKKKTPPPQGAPWQSLPESHSWEKLRRYSWNSISRGAMVSVIKFSSATYLEKKVDIRSFCEPSWFTRRIGRGHYQLETSRVSCESRALKSYVNSVRQIACAIIDQTMTENSPVLMHAHKCQRLSPLPSPSFKHSIWYHRHLRRQKSRLRQ